MDTASGPDSFANDDVQWEVATWTQGSGPYWPC